MTTRSPPPCKTLGSEKLIWAIIEATERQREATEEEKEKGKKKTQARVRGRKMSAGRQ